ncbi:MAG TPA: PEP-CTERM sorting domain-containing protein [Pirellulales bacterium]|nr:PEP-CTERM sorting domain-containing protein [Pirellulales bacterium]
MRKITLIVAAVFFGLSCSVSPAGTIEETLTIESPATISPGDVVVVLATLSQTPSNPTYTITNWSPNITVQTDPATTPQSVHFLYTSSFFTLSTQSVNATATLLQATLVPSNGNPVPVNQAGFTFSFIAPAPGNYTLVDTGTIQSSLGTLTGGASTPFSVVPEPASVSLMASGALAMVGFGVRRFRRRSAAPQA